MLFRSSGVWLAVALAGFTLIHELGHAFAARATGADAEISLNFFAGYASYRPTRPISRLERIGISFAGPGVQIATSVALLIALGVKPGDEVRRGDRVAQLVLAPVTRASWLKVDELDETSRGEGGFGSTGGVFAL